MGHGAAAGVFQKHSEGVKSFFLSFTKVSENFLKKILKSTLNRSAARGQIDPDCFGPAQEFFPHACLHLPL